MQLKQIRQRFLDYFAKNSHTIVASSSLIPHNDPTLLFTNAGMNQFKEVFLGEDKRDYIRAVTTQKCVRAGGKHNDLENVGYTARHHTFFEMLGNFSFGDYFKEQAIKYAWQFLTDELKIDKALLYVTVYHDDNESYNIWSQLGLAPEHIIRIGVKPDGSSDNFWQMGDTGPCGPCTEIFYDHGADVPGGLPGSLEQDGDRYIEVWNCVFMQFNRDSAGVLHKLPQPSVDTGMGLERIAAIMQGVHSNYDIDLFQDLIKATAKLTKCSDLNNNSLKVLADHIRSVAFLIADGVIPSNEGRGYVLRRIIRRAIRHGYKLSLREAFFYNLVQPLIGAMGEAYPQLIAKEQLISATIWQEELKFFQTIEKGMGLLQQELDKLKTKVLDGKVAFTLYDTYGFPLDLTEDICKEAGLSVDIDAFEQAMLQQKTLAKGVSKFIATNKSIAYTGAATEFLGYDLSTCMATVLGVYQEEDAATNDTCLLILDKTVFYAVGGGQVADKGIITLNNGMEVVVVDVFKIKNNVVVHLVSSDINQWQCGMQVNLKIDSTTRMRTARNHSATHLLHQALREYLGEQIEQKGSLVNDQYLRFDFSYNKSLSSSELDTIENKVNQAILANHQVAISSTSYQNALDQGAIALFGDKYEKDAVRLVKIGSYSSELCGGTHVTRSGDIGLFIINSESGIANGIRRIEAITGDIAYNQAREHYDLINYLRTNLKLANSRDISPKLMSLINDNKNLSKRLSTMEEKLALANLDDILKHKQVLSEDVNLIITELKNVNNATMMSVFQAIHKRLTKSIVVTVALIDDKLTIIAGVSKELTPRYDASIIAAKLATTLDGKAGGKAEFAKGSAKNYQQLPRALKDINNYIYNL